MSAPQPFYASVDLITTITAVRSRMHHGKAAVQRFYISAKGVPEELSTRDAWMASLCQQAKDQGFPVRLVAGDSWYGWSLQHVERVTTQHTEAAS